MGIKVSVVTATWNCAETIRDCLESVRRQSYPHIEHVVVDGGSSDGTVQVLMQNESSLGSLVSEPDNGIYDALNKGISRSTGDVIGFLHADDVYFNDDVVRRIAEAFSDPHVCAVYGDLQYVGKHDMTNVIRHWRAGGFDRRSLQWGWMPPHPTLYVRAEWYSRIGGFDTSYRISADYLSVLQMFSQSDFNATYLPHVLVKMRVGGASNRSLKNILLKSREDLGALRRTGVGAGGGFGALIWKNLRKLPQFFSTSSGAADI